MHVRDRCREAVGDCWRKLGPIEPTRGPGRPRAQMALPWPAFLWLTDRWALILILGCILLGTPISSGLWTLLLSETQVQDILCISSVFTYVFFI